MKINKPILAMILMAVTILSCGHNNQNQPSPKTQSAVKSISNSQTQKYLVASSKEGGWDVDEYNPTGEHLRKINKTPLSDEELGKALRVRSHWMHTFNLLILGSNLFVPLAVGIIVPGVVSYIEGESPLTLIQQAVAQYSITPWLGEIIHRNARADAMKGTRTMIFSSKKYDTMIKRIEDPTYNSYL
jgi:hypothetical protein